MKFLKVFLAALLAVVVGGVVSSLLWIFVFIGLAGSVESTTDVKPESVLVVDLAEDITDAPAANPFGAVDFQSFTVRKTLSLMQAFARWRLQRQTTESRVSTCDSMVRE